MRNNKTGIKKKWGTYEIPGRNEIRENSYHQTR
jgi:hypothetical protein